MPKVSVIMGVYNPKNLNLLSKSVNSIIQQSYKDWELIICDDGSASNYDEEIKKMEKRDQRIKVIRYSENKGLAYALNQCIAIAEGEYIARQDDDDISHLDRLEKQMDFCLRNPQYDIVGTCANVYDENGIWGEYSVCEVPEKKDFLWNSPFIHPSTIMKKESLNRVGGYRISWETKRCEDYDLFMRMYAAGMRGYNLQEKLYDYWLLNNPKKKYRPMKTRLEEAKVRFMGFKKMGILLKGLPYIFKPILIGLIPSFLFSKIRKKDIKCCK